MDAIFPKVPPHSDPSEVKQIGASRIDPAGFASRRRGTCTYGDDTHNYGLGQEGRKHRIDISCLNCSGAVPQAAVRESCEAATLSCTCRLDDAKRTKRGGLGLKQDPFESSWEVNSHSQDAKFNLLSITEYSALGTELAEKSTESKGASTSFGDFISFADELSSPHQEVGHVRDGKSSLYQPLDGSSWALEHNVDEKALVVKGNAPTAQQWETMRPLIQQLYLHEGRTLADVLEKLHKSHGFIASKKQFIRRLEKWKVRKNFKKEEIRVILEHLGENPPSSPTREVVTTLLRGRKLDSSTLKRWRELLLEPDCILASTGLSSLSENFQEPKEVFAGPNPSFKQLMVDQSSFACPFAKKDSLKYRSCLDFTLKRIRDVKQHLNRIHPLPIYCSRCMCILGSEDRRDEHIRASRCDIQTGITYEGVTIAQKAQLAQKVSSKITFEDQWFTIFDILFPDQIPRPKSAYKSLTVALDGFQDLTYADGPGIILKAMISKGISFAKPSNVESDQSGLVLSAIEDGLQQIMQRWTASMQLTPPNSSNPREAAAQEKSNLHTDQKIATPDQLHWSSDKLLKIFPEANTATPDGPQPGHDKHYEHGMDEFDQVSHPELLQEQPAWLDNNMDAQNFGDTGQPDELPAWYTDQRSLEPMFNGSMEDGNNMWQEFNQGDFFQMYECGAAEGSTQALDTADIYHQIIDEQQHVPE